MLYVTNVKDGHIRYVNVLITLHTILTADYCLIQLKGLTIIFKGMGLKLMILKSNFHQKYLTIYLLAWMIFHKIYIGKDGSLSASI